MAQSFWTEPTYQKFNKYVDWLKTVVHKLSTEKRKAHELKYKSGCAKVQQLALSWGVEWSPKFSSAKLFTPIDNPDKITWFNPKLKDSDINRVGVWFGDNCKEDGLFVFNVFWLLSFVDGMPLQQRKNRLRIFIELDCTAENYEDKIKEYEENEDVLTREGHPKIDHLFPEGE